MPEAIHAGPATPARLLLIDRDGATAEALAAPLAAKLMAAEPLIVARNGRHAAELLKVGVFDVVLADLSSLGDLSTKADEAVSRIARLAPDALIVVFLDAASVSAALSTMRAGAHECVTKPVSGEALALKIGALALRLGRPRALGVDSGQMIGQTWMEDQVVHAAEPAAPVLPLWRQEQRIIEDAIRIYAGNITLAAAALELSPSTIYRKRQAWSEMSRGRGAA
ncbi:MAG: helix-turn-helix domain-containing protein [Devosia sp.]